MNFKELYEGVTPKLPGAFNGVQVMTPQQFVAKAGDMPGEEPTDDVEEGVVGNMFNKAKGMFAKKPQGDNGAYPDGSSVKTPGADEWKQQYQQAVMAVKNAKTQQEYEAASDRAGRIKDLLASKGIQVGPVLGEQDIDEDWKKTLGAAALAGSLALGAGGAQARVGDDSDPNINRITGKPIATQQANDVEPAQAEAPKGYSKEYKEFLQKAANPNRFGRYMISVEKAQELLKNMQEGVMEELAEGTDHLARIRQLSGLGEATKLPASTRELGGQEFQDYMKRIVGTPDLDKEGNVKVDKKGNEKYVSGKTKSDKYKMPYIHRSSVIEYIGPDGKTYDEDKIKQTLAIRPKALLKQNEKMKHSNGEFEQFFNVGFAALTGIALDEQTNNLIIVNTCPGAGSCKVDCFAMKGGKVQFKAAWQSDGRILTYLLNDPDGFFNQLSSEISKEEAAGKKGDKKFPNGWQTTIRWHDAGDFFSPEYLDLALKMAAKHPDVKFYAYTKMAGAALAKKPANFIINWSEGAHTSQEKQVKASDANLDTTKNSRIVPDEIFQDLLVKDEKKNLVKGEQGQWQVQPDKLPELKQRLASQYGLSANSILSYDEYMAKRKSIPQGMKYNVIVAPGEGDISANDPNIISTLLLKH